MIELLRELILPVLCGGVACAVLLQIQKNAECDMYNKSNTKDE